MGIVSAVAIFFIIWWTVLFVVLPFGRRQGDEGDRYLGTQEGTPFDPRIARKAMQTTVISTVVFAIYYVLTQVYGFGFQDLPQIVPPIS